MHSAPMDEEQRIPKLAPGWDASGRALSPAEGFLLSRIDGRTSWTLLRQIGGLSPEEVDRCLERWLSEGVIVTEGGANGAGGALPPPAGIAEGAVDPALDLSVDLQRRILEFEAGLDRPYHQLLGVARDAEIREIKRAYFALSKTYHPDRYYRRELGPFGQRLERIFKKVVEAYELLCDPATRAEVERSLAQAPSGAGAAGAERAEAPDAPPRGYRIPSKREALERLRRRFRIPDEVLAERRFKARQFLQAAQLAAHREKWLEAAASVRLAVAFDPENAECKRVFAEMQGHVHQVRAADLLERAEESREGGAHQEAMRLLEEALSYRPCDPEINARAALVALELRDLDAALEYAESACEVEPEVSAHRRTLARVLRRQGQRDKARRVLEEAVRLDPEDAELRADLNSMRRPVRRRT